MEQENKTKHKKRGSQFVTRLIATILAVLMVAGVASTLIFYLLMK